MKSYFPYSPSTPSMIYGEVHTIQDGQILLNHIPYANSIEISGFTHTFSVSLSPGQFYCAYGSEYYYRESNCIVKFNAQHNGETVSVDYLQVGTIITANDMNEIKAHIEDNSIHNRYELPAATTATRGGVRVGQGLSILGDVLSADAQDYTLPSATNMRLGGVLVETDANIARTIEKYFPSTGETLPVHVQEIATRDSLGSVKIGAGLSITEDGLLTADAQDFTLTPASADSLGGVKIGSRLSIDTNGILSADALQTATTSRLGGVVVESDANIARTIERYFPSVTADTEIIPVLFSIPTATRESIGGVIIGGGLSIDTLGVLSADAQDFTLTPATADSLGGVLVESDENISRTIQRYFPTVSADEIIPVLTAIPVATDETLGGVKIGNGLSITKDGLLSADAQNFTLTPATRDSLGGVKIGARLSIDSLGVLSADTVQTYTLTAATTDSLGGVKIVDDSIIAAMLEEYFPTVSGETIAPLYSIPAATSDSLGGIKVGKGLSITKDGLLSADAQDFTLMPATYDSLGGVIPGVTMSIEDGVIDYYLPAASSTQLGGVKIGKGLTMTGEVLSADAQDFTLTPATSSQLGGVKIGARLSITADGILSADSVAPYTLPAASDEEISSMIEEYFPESLTPEPYTLPAATKYSLGGIIVGDRLSISNSGVLSANVQSYTLPTASASTKGGIKIGKGLTMTGEVLSANADNYTLPTATSSSLGGVKVGNTLTISNGVLDVPVASDEEISAIIENYFPASIEAGTVMGVQFVEDSDVNSMLATVFSGS